MSVDKNIQSTLWPLNLMQTICFYPKYRIKNNIIYPNSRLSNITSVCGSFLYISLFLLHIYENYCNDHLRKYLSFMYFAAYYETSFFTTGFILNCLLTIVQTHKNIDFTLTIQRIHRFLNNQKSFKSFTVVNWLIISWLLACHILITYCFYWSISSLFGFALICFDMNIIYATRCITFLKDMLDLWNEEVLRLQLMRDMDMKDYCKVMFHTYTDILSGYDTFKKTYKHFVSNCIFNLVSFSSRLFFFCFFNYMIVRIFMLFQWFISVCSINFLLIPNAF